MKNRVQYFNPIFVIFYLCFPPIKQFLVFLSHLDFSFLFTFSIVFPHSSLIIFLVQSTVPLVHSKLSLAVQNCFFFFMWTLNPSGMLLTFYFGNTILLMLFFSFTLKFVTNSSWSVQQFSHWGWTFSFWVIFRFVPRSFLPFTVFPKLLLIFMKACNGRMRNSSLRFAIYFLFTHNLKFACSVFSLN